MKNNKKFGLVVLCLALIVFLATVLAVNNCPTKEEYRLMVKAATNDYFSRPTYEKLMHLQNMLKVYATHDFSECLEEDALFEVQEEEAVQECSDGTAYYSCSVTKPKYCDNGTLVDNCQVCGCDDGYSCQEDGACVVLACSDGTLYSHCSSSKPLFCEDGSLINKCGVCGCPKDYTCKEDGSCVIKPTIEVLLLLMQAEKGLAEKALEIAKNTPIKVPERYGENVKLEIQRAEQWLNAANLKADQGKYELAIDYYRGSWEHSQKAIEFANKEKPAIGLPGCD